MQTCPKCNALVIANSVYCESCGWQLDKPIAAASDNFQASCAETIEQQAPADNAAEPQAVRPEAANGSVRSQISLLSGATRKFKASLRSLTSRKEHSVATASSPELPPTNEQKRSKTMNIIICILTGLGVLALWIWLLARSTGEKSLQLIQMLLKK